MAEFEVAENQQTSKTSPTPLIKKFQINLIPERCKGCTYCIEFCPKGVLQVSTKSNSKGYHLPEPARQEACIGCKLCEMICPDFCIFVEKLEKTEQKENE